MTTFTAKHHPLTVSCIDKLKLLWVHSLQCFFNISFVTTRPANDCAPEIVAAAAAAAVALRNGIVKLYELHVTASAFR